jgi:pSer/pThr/pTyr-binding forkhead associated (FHA) protein
MSRNHFRIEMSSSGVPVLYDLGSLAGTQVNGKTVISVALKSGDEITSGTTKFIFLADGK